VDHPHVEAYGTIDELNAALGLARSMAAPACVHETIMAVQRDLVILMGELAKALLRLLLSPLPVPMPDRTTVSADLKAVLERKT
jgi:hypothetical protein